jgi:hypothetical protein
MSAGFPTLEQVESAGVEQVLRWNRFLPSPKDDGDVEVIRLNCERLAKLRGEDNAAYVAASKSIGWDR